MLVDGILSIKMATYHTEDLPLLVYLPIVEADDSFDILQLLQKINLALVASHCSFICVFKLHSLQRKQLEVLCHDTVHG